MMRKILKCRRSLIALFGMSCLTMLGMYTQQDISGIAIAISGIAAAVCGANAYEGARTGKRDGVEEKP